MSIAEARRVADALLYEGYLLYPYRADSAKNQVRWQFGVLGPIGASVAGVGEDPQMQTECLLTEGDDLRVDVELRYLHVQHRSVERVSDGGFEAVNRLTVGSASWIPWHEAVQEQFAVLDQSLDALLVGRSVPLEVPGGQDIELLFDDDGRLVGRLIRTRWPLSARLELSAYPVPGESLIKLRANVRNRAGWDGMRWDGDGATARDQAARISFVGAHLLLAVRGGAFMSLADPTADAAEAAAACVNQRCWPILIGAPEDSNLMLASPIILDDHPVIAPESQGDLFDLTEIDEILILRILTMTDEEKAAARGTDPRAAAILDRCEGMSVEAFERLHGAVRSARTLDLSDVPTLSEPSESGMPWWDPGVDSAVSPESDTVEIDSVPVSKGSRVLLRPSRRADAQDLFLAGRVGIVTGVFFDVDGKTHVAVVPEDDPAADLHEWYGRFWYFGTDEIVPLGPDSEDANP